MLPSCNYAEGSKKFHNNIPAPLHFTCWMNIWRLQGQWSEPVQLLFLLDGHIWRLQWQWSGPIQLFPCCMDTFEGCQKLSPFRSFDWFKFFSKICLCIMFDATPGDTKTLFSLFFLNLFTDIYRGHSTKQQIVKRYLTKKSCSWVFLFHQ